MADCPTIPTLPRRPSGRVDRDAADAHFEVIRAEVEAAPEDWRGWYRLAHAYDLAGDRKRARSAMRHAIELAHGRRTGADHPVAVTAPGPAACARTGIALTRHTRSTLPEYRISKSRLRAGVEVPVRHRPRTSRRPPEAALACRSPGSTTARRRAQPAQRIGRGGQQPAAVPTSAPPRHHVEHLDLADRRSRFVVELAGRPPRTRPVRHPSWPAAPAPPCRSRASHDAACAAGIGQHHLGRQQVGEGLLPHLDLQVGDRRGVERRRPSHGARRHCTSRRR